MAEDGKNILFSNGDIKFALRNKAAIIKWLNAVSQKHRKKIASLNYIFVSDDFLLEINKRFLKHNTLTDIITFDYSDKSDKKTKNEITGEIYISLPRVTDNAKIYKVSKTEELHRVMAHGLLHLCGFGDKSPREIKQMRSEEENALNLRRF